MSTSIGVLLVGCGEYTTGFIETSTGTQTSTDKSAGVILLTVIDLRNRDLVSRVALCGRNSKRMAQVQQHIDTVLKGRYGNISIDGIEMFPSPSEDEDDVLMYERAIDTFSKGDLCIITTPDPTHAPIALAASNRGLHVMIAKPITQDIESHQSLIRAARQSNVLICLRMSHSAICSAHASIQVASITRDSIRCMRMLVLESLILVCQTTSLPTCHSLRHNCLHSNGGSPRRATPAISATISIHITSIFCVRICANSRIDLVVCMQWVAPA